MANDFVDNYTALFPKDMPKWSSNTITYNFMPFLPERYSLVGRVIEAIELDGRINPVKNFKAFDNLQKAAAENVLGLWAEVANIKFEKRDDRGLKLSNFVDFGPIIPILEAVDSIPILNATTKKDFLNGFDNLTKKFALVAGADIRFGTNDQGSISSGAAFYPPDNSFRKFNELRQNLLEEINRLVEKGLNRVSIKQLKPCLCKSI